MPYSSALENELDMSDKNDNSKTSIQVTTQTRDRLYRLKFRRTYDQFLNELCDMYEKMDSEESENLS